MLPYDPMTSFLGMYGEIKTCPQKTCMQIFMAAFFIIAKKWKQSKSPSTSKCVNKMW